MEQKGRTREQEKDDLMRTPTLTSGDTHVDTPSAETPLNIPWTHSSSTVTGQLLGMEEAPPPESQPPENPPKQDTPPETTQEQKENNEMNKQETPAASSWIRTQKKNKCPDGTRWKLTSLMLLNAGVHVCKCL